jgi:hypothetical protein
MTQDICKTPQLPDNASLDSHRLLAVAQAVIKQCPQVLYDEVAITGSVSRGQADHLSDVEVIFFVEQIQARTIYEQWMESLDEYDSTIPTRTSGESDEFYVLECYVKGIEVGILWMTWNWLDKTLTQIVEDPLRTDLVMAWVINHLVPIGKDKRLSSFKRRAKTYPDETRQIIIEAHLAHSRKMLAVPHILFAINSSIRGSIYDWRRRQFYGIEGWISLLFAFNRHWLVDTKWLAPACSTMKYIPENFIERLNALLTTSDPKVSYDLLVGINIDVFTILAEEFEVNDILAFYKTYRDLGFKHWIKDDA